VRDSVKTHNKEVSKYLIVYNLDLQDTAIQIYSLRYAENLSNGEGNSGVEFPS
jgi:hypothetical protein